MMSLAKFICSIILVNQVFSSHEKCVSNLECLNSACCRGNVCVSNEECRNDMVNVYIAVGVVGIAFILATVGYLYISIKASRENVRKIKEKLKANN